MGPRDGDIDLEPGEFLIVPHGVEHRPEALSEECSVMPLEPKTTLNIGNVVNERTVREMSRLEGWPWAYLKLCNPSPSHPPSPRLRRGALPLPPGEVFRAFFPSPVGRRRGLSRSNGRMRAYGPGRVDLGRAA